jgi:hypothetical protein
MMSSSERQTQKWTLIGDPSPGVEPFGISAKNRRILIRLSQVNFYSVVLILRC